jgi:enoyl-CoA hydratase/carnithine racemase
MLELKTILTIQEDHVLYATLNRPHKANAFNYQMWFEIEVLAQYVDQSKDIRVLVLQGVGKHFSAGIDFSLIMKLVQEVSDLADGYKQEVLRTKIVKMQKAFTALEECRKPVIAAIHGSCMGAGVDLITACDIRYASTEARFCVKEIDLAIVADIGTLQRLPTLVGEGVTREWAMTGRIVDTAEAEAKGLISRVFDSPEDLQQEVKVIAQQIACKSPLTQRGIKQVMNYGRDKSVADGLAYVATWNSATLLSSDSQEALAAMMTKREPHFKD